MPDPIPPASAPLPITEPSIPVASTDPVLGSVGQSLAPPRHPLWMPKGSIRAVVALLVAGTLYYRLAVGLVVPDVLLTAMFMVLGYYFAVRVGEGPSADKPLWLPRGSIRTLLVLGFVVAAVWLIVETFQATTDFGAGVEAIKAHALFPVVAQLGGFYAGRIVRLGVLTLARGPQNKLALVVGDVKGAAGILAGVGCLLVFNTTLFDGLEPALRQDVITGILSVITFYFGTR